jgi:hypothetical protein
MQMRPYPAGVEPKERHTMAFETDVPQRPDDSGLTPPPGKPVVPPTPPVVTPTGYTFPPQIVEAETGIVAWVKANELTVAIIVVALMAFAISFIF